MENPALDGYKDIQVNKGELLFSEEDFGIRSEARNRLLVDLLARTDFMEKAGTGIKRITESCKKNNNKVSFGFSDSFLVTIDTNIKEDVTEDVTETRSDLILALIKNNKKITTSEIGQKINISRRTVAREIDALKKEGMLKRIGPDKGGEWKVLKNRNIIDHELHGLTRIKKNIYVICEN